jgi:hypothetical protein
MLQGNGRLANIIGIPLDTTLVSLHLRFEGTLHRFPGLRFCTAQVLPAVRQRPVRSWLCDLPRPLQHDSASRCHIYERKTLWRSSISAQRRQRTVCWS